MSCHVRRSLSVFVVVGLFGTVRIAAAEGPPPASAQQMTTVDFAAIPRATVPPPPPEAPDQAAEPRGTKTAGLIVEKAEDPRFKAKVKHLSASLRRKLRGRKEVEIKPVSSAEPGAIYVPSADTLAFEGETLRTSCAEAPSSAPVRWETLAVTADGNARLEVRDLRLGAETCAVSTVASAVVVLQAIAWNDGKPWLFAARDEHTLTLVMPRTTDVNAESMVGQATTVSGGMTRVSLPLGRWGAASLAAHAPTLEIEGALAARAKASGEPTAIAVELVQTMAEKTPTLLVRVKRPESVASTEVMSE